MKAFVIHLPGRRFSNAHARTMISELIGFEFDAELFEGTEGDAAPEKMLLPCGIKSSLLSSDETHEVLQPYVPNDFFQHYDVELIRKIPWTETEVIKVSRPGVKGCFDSHYRLWKKCIDLKEPIAIFEDDVKFFRGYRPIDFDDILIVSVGKTAYKDDPYKEYLECPSGTHRPMAWRNYSMPGTSGYIIMPHAARRLVKAYRDWYLPADNAINKSLVNIQIHNYLMGRHMHESEGNVSAL